MTTDDAIALYRREAAKRPIAVAAVLAAARVELARPSLEAARLAPFRPVRLKPLPCHKRDAREIGGRS